MPELVACYRGRKVTDLTRDELIEAYTRLSEQTTRERQFEIACHEFDRYLRRDVWRPSTYEDLWDS